MCRQWFTLNAIIKIKKSHKKYNFKRTAWDECFSKNIGYAKYQNFHVLENCFVYLSLSNKEPLVTSKAGRKRPCRRNECVV